MIGISLSKIINKRVLGRFTLGILLLFVAVFSVYQFQSKRIQSLDVSAKAVVFDMPANNWRVCEDLGFGDVPGLDETRQRLRLCHNQGWEILAYCLQPHILAPPVDTVCENTSGSIYWCGDTYQLLSEYDILLTPTPTATNTPTSTHTPVPTATNTPSPTISPGGGVFPIQPTATARTGPGGKGNLGWIIFCVLSGGILIVLALKLKSPITRMVSAKRKPEDGQHHLAPTSKTVTFLQNPLLRRCVLYFLLMVASAFLGFWATKMFIAFPAEASIPGFASPTGLPTAFWGGISTPNPPHHHPTQVPTQPMAVDEIPAMAAITDPKIDFSPLGKRITLQIDPPNVRVNRGKLLQISFLPGVRCTFGDQHACVTPYGDESSNHIFVSIHSGVGGEGQSFRHALEGTGINRTGYLLEKVDQNIKALQAAEVTILQDGDESGGFFLVGLTRIPPESLDTYLKLPVVEAISFAILLDPVKMRAVDPNLPMLVFETCGWKMPSEPWLPSVTSTTGSIYLGVIQKRP